jgi:hypothetical protein
MNKTDEKATELAEILQKDLRGIELDVMTNYTLADAIREGSQVSEQAHGWGGGEKACAMHAAVIAAKARKQL